MDTDHEISLQTSPAQISEKRVSIAGAPWDKIVPETTRQRSNTWPMASLGIQPSHIECAPGSDKAQADELVLRANSKFARYIDGGHFRTDHTGGDLVSEKNPRPVVATVDAGQPLHADTDNDLGGGCDLAKDARTVECGDIVILGDRQFEYRACYAAVSYTHLTLTTTKQV